VFLSRLSSVDREALLSAELERFTKTTITDHEKLAHELEVVTRDGFAIGAGEHEELTSAACAPVLDPANGRLVSIVDVWGPSQRLPRRRLRQIGPRVRDIAERIAALLAQREAELS
jgi:DNA-binding IclR family transcriptional regulator